MPGRKETVAFYPSRYLPATHGSDKTPVDSVRYVIIRDARPDEHTAVGELRVSAYRALGLLPDGSEYAKTLRGFGFGGDCTVLVAVDEADDSLIGTVTLEPFDPASELAQDDTEADIRAFAVAAQAQGKGVGRKLLLAAIEYAEKHGLRRLRLCTQPAMLAAQHLYAATGFSRTPELDFSPVPGITLRAYQLDLRTGRLFSPHHGGSHLSPPPLPLPAVTARRHFGPSKTFEDAFSEQ
jgi:ribosomal protein S18 acetylase RimI-like enzyme